MVGYEEHRFRRIEENRRKMMELNLKPLAFEALGSVKGKKQKINKSMSPNNDEYIPNEEVEQSSEGDEIERLQTSKNLRVGSKKVMANGRGNLGKSNVSMASIVHTRSQNRLSQKMKDKEKGLPPPGQKAHLEKNGGISSQTISQHNTNMSNEMNVPMRDQHLVKNNANANAKKGQGKTMVAPGTLGSFLRMKEISKENERLRKQKDDINPPMDKLQRQIQSYRGSELFEGDGGCRFEQVHYDEGSHMFKDNTNEKKRQRTTRITPGTLNVSLGMKEKLKENELLRKQKDVTDQLMQSSQRQQASYSGLKLPEGGGGCRLDLLDEDDEDDGYQTSHEFVVEEHDIDPVVQKTNELIPTQDQPTIQNNGAFDQHQPTDQLGKARKEKRTRGPTMCKDVHEWTLNDRKPILLNGNGQPIGPDDVTLRQFTRFYGSIARDPNLAPLNFYDWRYVPNKDNIWDYVKKKFIIPEKGEDYVLSSIGALWRTYKSRLKKAHYTPYDNVNDRWQNRPKTVPDDHFKDLLGYWDSEEVKKLSDQNKKHSEGRKDRHTMGPISFARKRYELEKAENKPPSEVVMYKETRKRIEGRKYKTSYTEEVPNLGKKILLGRCAKKEKEPSKSGVIIPDDILLPYKAQFLKEAVGEVMKLLKDQIPSEMLASVASSLNGHTLQDLNNEEQYQDDLEGEDVANKDDMEGEDVANNEEDVEGNIQHNEDEDYEDN